MPVVAGVVADLRETAAAVGTGRLEQRGRGHAQVGVAARGANAGMDNRTSRPTRGRLVPKKKGQ